MANKTFYFVVNLIISPINDHQVCHNGIIKKKKKICSVNQFKETALKSMYSEE